MTEAPNDTFDSLLIQTIPNASIATDRGQTIVTIPVAGWADAARSLRDTPGLDFSMLIDLCGVDYLTYGEADWNTQSATTGGFSRAVQRGVRDTGEDAPARFAVAYQLLSLRNNRRLRVKVFLEDDPPVIPSVVDVWAGANWYEREAFDLYGILFRGHPDLRRLLTDYGFIGHPFRKDFPLEGKVEVRYDPDQKRVIYQPVTIENRVLVPRVIRDERPIGRGAADEASTDA